MAIANCRPDLAYCQTPGVSEGGEVLESKFYIGQSLGKSGVPMQIYTHVSNWCSVYFNNIYAFRLIVYAALIDNRKRSD